MSASNVLGYTSSSSSSDPSPVYNSKGRLLGYSRVSPSDSSRIEIYKDANATELLCYASRPPTTANGAPNGPAIYNDAKQVIGYRNP